MLSVGQLQITRAFRHHYFSHEFKGLLKYYLDNLGPQRHYIVVLSSAKTQVVLSSAKTLVVRTSASKD